MKVTEKLENIRTWLEPIVARANLSRGKVVIVVHEKQVTLRINQKSYIDLDHDTFESVLPANNGSRHHSAKSRVKDRIKQIVEATGPYGEIRANVAKSVLKDFELVQKWQRPKAPRGKSPRLGRPPK